MIKTRLLALAFAFPLLAAAQPVANAPDIPPIWENENECMEFHEGTFEYVETSLQDFTITRKKGKQIEASRNDPREALLRCEWISPCEYTLKTIKIIDNEGNKVDLKDEIEIYVRIIKIEGDTYTYVFLLNGKSGEGKMRRISE